MSTYAEQVEFPAPEDFIHVYSFTGSMCAQIKIPPHKWPEGLRGVSLDEWEKATCPRCLRAARDHSKR